MQCPTCGSSVTDADLCPKCGTELTPVAPAKNSSPTQSAPSLHGTYVRSNGGAFSRVGDEHILQNGDEIALGNARFIFQIGESRS